MSARSGRHAVAFLALLSAFAWGQAIPAAGREKITVTIPARQRVVALMQDVCRLRSITLVSYQGSVVDTAPSLHMWDGSRWNPVSVDGYGRLCDGAKVLVVGNDDTLPGVVLEASGVKPVRIDGLDVSVIVNQLKTEMRLTAREITWLADRNGMTAKDNNAYRRRWGKYGKPGDKPQVSQPPAAAEEESLESDADTVKGAVEEPVVPEDFEKGDTTDKKAKDAKTGAAPAKGRASDDAASSPVIPELDGTDTDMKKPAQPNPADK